MVSNPGLKMSTRALISVQCFKGTLVNSRPFVYRLRLLFVYPVLECTHGPQD